MSKKISYKKERLVQELYAKNLSDLEIARKVKISISTVYCYTTAKQRGFASYKEYKEYLAQKNGFSSYGKYMTRQAKEAQKRPENKDLSNLIKTRLKELGKNQSWLATEIGSTRQAVSLYVHGKSFPNKNMLENLYSSLDIPHTLDDLV